MTVRAWLEASGSRCDDRRSGHIGLRYGKGFEAPGLYRVTVQVSGNNFGARSVQFCVLVSESGRPEVLTEAAWLARLSDPAAGQAALPAPREPVTV